MEGTMAYIIEQKVGKHKYLYECESYRNKEGKPRSRRIPIGKIDPVSGERRFKAEYIERMRAAGTPVELSPTEKRFSLEDVRKSVILEYGAFYLLRGIAGKIGLTGVLAEALPDVWQEVFMLALHLVCNGEPFMHCSEWIEGSESYSVGNMSSQRVSELLSGITAREREYFYQAWCRRRLEEEYLAIDITSVSSYSDLVEDVEWGYNRDDEALPQINICMLMGETSKMPIYQTVYAGSLKDVVTLDATTRSFDAITGGKPMLAVMDKGFFSKKNVDAMLLGRHKRKFVIAVPFTSGFARKHAENERKGIDTVHSTIRVGSDTLRAVTRECKWENGANVYVHIYFAPGKAHSRREDIFGHVSMLRDEAEEQPEKCAKSDEHKKYLSIRKSGNKTSGYTVKIREDTVNDMLGTQGWLVIISNDVKSAKEAIQIYRAKDVVEKGFLRLKRDLDLGRLRVHSQERTQNKVFIGFIALILLSRIHYVMMEHGFYRKMTLKKLIRTMAKQRVQTIGNERVLYPATKLQRDIYDAFALPPPL
jgi:transposase